MILSKLWFYLFGKYWLYTSKMLKKRAAVLPDSPYKKGLLIAAEKVRSGKWTEYEAMQKVRELRRLLTS